MEYFTHSWDFKITTRSQVFLQFHQGDTNTISTDRSTGEKALQSVEDKDVILQSPFFLISFCSFPVIQQMIAVENIISHLKR